MNNLNLLNEETAEYWMHFYLEKLNESVKNKNLDMFDYCLEKIQYFRFYVQNNKKEGIKLNETQ